MSQLLGDVPFAHLPSQQLLCQRIHSQIRFKSSLVVVGGSDGCGKSLLAQELLEQAQFSEHALVSVDSESEDSDFRKSLLLQLTSDPLFNQDDPLVDSLFRNLAQVSGPQLIVIDNAHHLSEDLILELVVMLRSYPSRYGQRLSIILIGNEDPLFAQAETVIGQSDLEAIWLSIPILSNAEVGSLARLLFERAGYQAEMENREAIERHLASARSNPKRVVYFVDQIVNGEVTMSDTQSSKKNLVLLAVAVLLIAALAGLLYQMLSNSAVIEPTRTAIDSTEVAQLNAENAVQESDSSSNPGLVEQADNSDLNSSTAPSTDSGYGSDTAILPEAGEVKEVLLDANNDDSGLRIVVEDEVVSRIIEEQSNPQAVVATGNQTASAPAIESTENTLESAAQQLESSATQSTVGQASEEAQVQVEANVTPVEAESEQVTQSQAVTSETAPTTEVATPVASAPSTSAQHPLQKIDANRYTLQLIALASESKAKGFADSKPWAQPVWVYRSNINPKSPYKVVYGNFDNRQIANEARLRLKQQGIDSLLKQFKQVHFEMQP